jgi:hypothetical protein
MPAGSQKILKRVAQWTGMSENRVSQVGGQYIHVGGAQALFALNLDLGLSRAMGLLACIAHACRYGDDASIPRWTPSHGSLPHNSETRITH